MRHRRLAERHSLPKPSEVLCTKGLLYVLFRSQKQPLFFVQDGRVGTGQPCKKGIPFWGYFLVDPQPCFHLKLGQLVSQMRCPNGPDEQNNTCLAAETTHFAIKLGT